MEPNNLNEQSSSELFIPKGLEAHNQEAGGKWWGRARTIEVETDRQSEGESKRGSESENENERSWANT